MFAKHKIILSWSYPLCKIVKLWIKRSVFPEECKITNIRPLFNRSQKLQTFTLLPVVSKIIEKSIHYQLQDYLKENGLLYKCQSGLRANFSTDSCLAQTTDFV